MSAPGLTSRSFASRLALAGGGSLAALIGAATARVQLIDAVVVPVLAMGLALAGIVRALTPAEWRRWMSRWTGAAFGLHFAIGAVILSAGSLTGYFGGDSVTYQEGAKALVAHWQHGTPIPPTLMPAGKTGFIYLLGALYTAFGAYPIAGVVVNAALAAAVVPLLTDATRRQFGDAAALRVPLIATLLPGFLIWGSQLLREAGVYFFLAVALNCAIRLLHGSAPAALLFMVAAIVLCFTFRADVALIAAAALVVALAVGTRQGGRGVATGLGAAALVLALVVGAGLGYSGYRFVTHTNLQQVNSIRSDSSLSASSGYLPQASVSSTSRAASYMPLGSLYFLLGPAPWQVHGLRQLVALPDVLIWWYLLPSLARGLRDCRRRRGREYVVFALPALLLTAALCLLVANFGTAVRERMQVIIFLVPPIAAGLALRSSPGRPVPAVTAAPESKAT